MSTPLQPVFVLHRRPWRETSLLLELFSRDEGRVGVVARGARRRRAAVLVGEPFTEHMARWSGRGELARLDGCELAGNVVRLRGTALFSALYLNEVLMRMLHRHDPHPDLYAGYRATLGELARGVAIEPVLRLFERGVLEACGYGLQLDHEADGSQAVEPQAVYRYVPERGPVRVDGRTVDGTLISGRALLALAAGTVSEADDLAACKRLLREALEPHLGTRPLRSRELFRRPDGGRRVGAATTSRRV